MGPHGHGPPLGQEGVDLLGRHTDGAALVHPVAYGFRHDSSSYVVRWERNATLGEEFIFGTLSGSNGFALRSLGVRTVTPDGEGAQSDACLPVRPGFPPSRPDRSGRSQAPSSRPIPARSPPPPPPLPAGPSIRSA